MNKKTSKGSQAANEIPQARAAQAVKDVFPALLRGQHSAIFQYAQVAGYGRYIPLRSRVQLAHAALPLQQHQRQPQPHRMPQRLKYARQPLRLRSIKCHTIRANIIFLAGTCTHTHGRLYLSFGQMSTYLSQASILIDYLLLTIDEQE